MNFAAYKQTIIEKIQKLRKTGFFSIFLSNILSKVVVFLGGIVLVRILSQNDYGIYSYAINAFSILFILNDFGASNAALQNITEQKDNKKKQQAIIEVFNQNGNSRVAYIRSTYIDVTNILPIRDRGSKIFNTYALL